MKFPVSPRYKAIILRQYDRNMSAYPLIREKVDAYLRDQEEDLSLCLKYLYGNMAAQDVLSSPVELFASYGEATLRACEEMDYLRDVPEEIFFPYVLYHRVNSECLDDSRGFLMGELLPYVKGKRMEQAALNVNYWCYAHATYTPSDYRTLGPLGILRSTLGRCGEETVLAVAALRSVGIPARQCYCPKWAHCDDNHAWVEVWVEGQWHYMGACEPEAVLDRGWFTSAASRAMLVDTKCWGDPETETLYKAVQCTSRYAPTRVLTVKVTEGGQPVANARVCFQIVNYSELFTLREALTDEQGRASFETGLGDLFVCAVSNGKVALEKVDLRQKDTVSLELQSSFPEFMTADIVPPEDSSGTVPHVDHPRHRELLRRCEAHAQARRDRFSTEKYLSLAGLNASELRAFLEMDRYSREQKEELLSTLRPKDFADIRCETLVDAMESAESARGQYPPDIFRDYILAPRIAEEMLLPERRKIRSLFPRSFTEPDQISEWMESHMELLPDRGIRNFYPSLLACLENRQVPTFVWDALFVAVCRAFCLPAAIEPHTGHGQWLDRGGLWHSIRPKEKEVKLHLELPQGKKLRYAEHITVARWDGGNFVTLKYSDTTVEKDDCFSLQPGFYRVTVNTRQIDGTASVALWHLPVSEDRSLAITPPEDQTFRRLKQIPLELPQGPLKTLLDRERDRRHILIFADPGSEPTEHLLTEMLESAEEFQNLDCRILLFTESEEALSHPTLQGIKSRIPNVQHHGIRDPQALACLYRQMKVGDLRLPFVLCTDHKLCGVYADANYRIRLAQTLLDIQRYLQSRIDP